MATPPGYAATEPAAKKTSAGTMGCAVILLLLLGWCVTSMVIFDDSGPVPPAAVPAPVAAQPVLELESWTWAEQHTYAIAEGRVKNISARSLENVQAQVSYATKDGSFITSDSSMIDFNPILPGQSSPFKVMTRWNPAMAKASITFKTLFGGELRWQDKPPKK